MLLFRWNFSQGRLLHFTAIVGMREGGDPAPGAAGASAGQAGPGGGFRPAGLGAGAGSLPNRESAPSVGLMNDWKSGGLSSHSPRRCSLKRAAQPHASSKGNTLSCWAGRCHSLQPPAVSRLRADLVWHLQGCCLQVP